MQIIWVRHAEPERVEAGTGVPANPPLTARGRRAGRARSPRGSRSSRSTRSCRARSCRARETARAVAVAHGLDGRDRRRAGRVRRAGRPLHPDGRAARRRRTSAGSAMVEGRWGEFGGEEPGRRSRPASRATVDEIVGAHPGETVVAVCHGGVINVALAAVLGLDRRCGSTRATRRSRGWSRRGRGPRSLQSLNETRASLRDARGHDDRQST